MGRKLIFIFALFFLFIFFLIINNSNDTYAYEDCHNKKVVPKGITTLNLKDYVKSNLNLYIKKMCSYDKCYYIREDNINESVDNFRKIFDKFLNENDYYEVNIKGYPITEIIVDEC